MALRRATRDDTGTDMIAARAWARWRMLPVRRLEAIVGAGAPLILAPHQDDESLGCGGLIAACVARGTPPVLAFLTDGSRSHPQSHSHPAPVLARLRQREARAALARLGVRRAVFLGAQDAAAPTDGPAFAALATRLTRLARGCSAIVAAWAGDPHCDHRAGARLAATVAARTGLPHVSYPVWGWMLPATAPVAASPMHGARLAVAPRLPAKRGAVAAHRSQLGRIVTDDPDGFTLPPALLARMLRPHEVYLW